MDDSTTSESAIEILRWGKLRKLSGNIYPTTSPYGRPSCLHSSASYLAVGTESADVLIFKYDQDLVAVLDPNSAIQQRWGHVTAISISHDEARVVAGYSLGGVVIWELKSASVVLVAPALTEPPRFESPIPDDETHLIGTPVVFVQFCGPQRSSVVSGDERGVVVFHRGVRVLLDSKMKMRSRRIVGMYASATHLLGCAVMDGPEKSILIAALTVNTLVVVVIEQAAMPRIVLKLPRMRSDNEQSDSGCLVYDRLQRKLIYTWGNQLNVLNIVSKTGGIFEADRALDCAVGDIDFCSWFDSNMLLLKCGNKLVFVRSDTMQIVACEPILESDVIGITVLRESAIFVMGKYEFVYASPVSWTDCLMSLLNQSKPIQAIETAKRFHTGDFDFVVSPKIIGLPDAVPERQTLVKNMFPELIITSLRFALEHDNAVLKRLVPACVEAVIITGLPMLEEVLELFTSEPRTPGKEAALQYYLDCILKFLSMEPPLKRIPPIVFKELASQRVHDIEHVIFTLDPLCLDLDEAYAICKELHLSKGSAYISTTVFHDYIAPLNDSGLDVSEYLTAVLTGKYFPTLEEMSETESLESKRQIYSAMFSGEMTLLTYLLVKDESGVLKALDAAFAEPYFNGQNDSGVSRQVIVDTLTQIVKNTSDLDTEELDIFVARNAARYTQFILLSGARSEQILHRLVSSSAGNSKEKENRELAIMSLLGIYTPADYSELVRNLKQMNYYTVLERIYLKMHDFTEVALIHIEQGDAEIWPTLSAAFAKDRNGAAGILKSHFKRLSDINTGELARTCIKYGSVPWNEVEQLSIDNQLQFYEQSVELSSTVPPQMACAGYIRLLTEYRPKELMTVVQNTLKGKNDISVPAVVDKLIEFGREDVLALLLARLGRRSEAMIYLNDHILKTNEASRSIVDVATIICTNETSINHESGLSLWKKLVAALLDINADVGPVLEALSEVEGKNSTTDLVDVVTSIVEKHTPSSWSVIDRLLHNLRQQQTLLMSIQSILERDLFEDVQQVIVERCKGWAVAIDGECEGCGGKIVGVGVNAAVLYDSWEKKMTRSTSETNEASGASALILFACGHSYHLTCIERLGTVRECLVCS